MKSSNILEDLVRASTTRSILDIIKDLGDEPYTILLDESRNLSIKEQIITVLTYVFNTSVRWRTFFTLCMFDIQHVLSLKVTIKGSLSKCNLCLGLNTK